MRPAVTALVVLVLLPSVNSLVFDALSGHQCDTAIEPSTNSPRRANALRARDGSRSVIVGRSHFFGAVSDCALERRARLYASFARDDLGRSGITMHAGSKLPACV